MTAAYHEEGFLTHKRRAKLTTFFFLLPAMAFLIVYSYISFILTLGLSFFKVDWLSRPEFVGLANFVKVTHYDLFWKSIWNISLYVVETVGFGLVAGLLFASLMEQKVKGLGFFRVAYFMPLVISAAATAWIFRLLFSEGFGLVPLTIQNVTSWISNLAVTWGGLHLEIGKLFFSKPVSLKFLGDPKWAMTSVAIMTMWGGLGYWILIYTAGLRSIDPELYESAMIDGAGYWRRTVHITIPLLRHVILFLSITGIIRAFQLFAIIMIIPPYGSSPGAPDDSTQVPILLIYNIAFGQMDFGYASALAAVIFVILVVLTAVQAWMGRLTQA